MGPSEPTNVISTQPTDVPPSAVNTMLETDCCDVGSEVMISDYSGLSPNSSASCSYSMFNITPGIPSPGLCIFECLIEQDRTDIHHLITLGWISI